MRELKIALNPAKLNRTLMWRRQLKGHIYDFRNRVNPQKGGFTMQIVIGAIGVLTIAILGYLTWVLMKEE